MLVVNETSGTERQTLTATTETPALSVRIALAGSPVVQREVALYDAAGRLVETQTTDADGVASFAGLEKKERPVLPGAEVHVVVADPLFDPVDERVVLCADADLDLEVELRPVRGLRLDVFVRSKTGPENVPVVLRDEAGVVVFNETSRDGAVAFECSSADGLLETEKRYVLRVEGTAFQLAEHRFVYVENQSVTLFLEPAGSFSVQLLDGGLPRPGLAVALRRGITVVASGVTDAAGVARFEGSRWALELGALYAVLVDGAEEGSARYEAEGQTAVLDLKNTFTVKLVNQSGKAVTLASTCTLTADGLVVASVGSKSGVCSFDQGVARGMVLRVSFTQTYKAKEVVLSGYGFGETLQVVVTKVAGVTVTVTEAGSVSPSTYIAGASVQFRRADGKLSEVFRTDGSGVVDYTCDEGNQMELGDHQTAIVSAEGYVTAEVEFVVVTEDTKLAVALAKDENISYELGVVYDNSTVVSGATVSVGNAKMEYRELGTTGTDGKVAGKLAAAELFFVREGAFHLKVDYKKNGTPITEYLAVDSGDNKLLVPKEGDVKYTVKLAGQVKTQLELHLYDNSGKELDYTSLTINSVTFTDTGTD